MSTYPPNPALPLYGMYTQTGPQAADFEARLAITNVVNPLDVAYGAKADNATDDTAALNAANTVASATGALLYLPAGKVFRTTGTFTVTTPILATGATINYTGSGIAVQLGDGVHILGDAQFALPKIVQVAKTGLGWGTFTGTDISASIGVKITGLYEGTVYVPYVSNFAIGVQEYGTALGMAYSKLLIGHLHNNKINHQITGDNAAGWVNENSHYGGRFSHDSGELQGPNTATTGQPGVRHVQVTALVSIVNNHRWLHTSLEGDVPEYHVELNTAQSNLFDHCRWEATNPKVLISGATSTDNWFRGGIQGDSVVYTFANSAPPGLTRVEHQGGLEWAPANASGGLKLGNTLNSADPVMTLFDAGINPHNYSGTNWSVQLGSRTLVGKASADAPASPKITANFATGQMLLASLGVGGSSAATTPGSVVKKLPLYDQAGTLLGYLPIYSAIT